MQFEESELETLNRCPWCESTNFDEWGRPTGVFNAARCGDCGLIFMRTRLNATGLERYYSTYLSQAHQADDMLNKQRAQMYRIDFDFIHQFINRGRVLDVGCSGGYFLDVFAEHGFDCLGVEFGAEAASTAAKKFKIWNGDFPTLDIRETFDLVIFRGVIEHVPEPRAYLEKAVSLLNPKGLLFITATPNADALCCDLFKEQWNQHLPESHLMHFRVDHFDHFFAKAGLRREGLAFFYEETPYAAPEEDILAVARAIDLRRQSKNVPFRSPSFWGNMMTVAYRRT